MLHTWISFLRHSPRHFLEGNLGGYIPVRKRPPDSGSPLLPRLVRVIHHSSVARRFTSKQQQHSPMCETTPTHPPTHPSTHETPQPPCMCYRFTAVRTAANSCGFCRQTGSECVGVVVVLGVAYLLFVAECCCCGVRFLLLRESGCA